MESTGTTESTKSRLLKGLLAGLVAGLVATAAKSVAERFYPPRTHGEPEPPELLADKIAGHHLEGASAEFASEAIHWGFGALTGAAYGALAEFYPAATAKEGASFGMALMTLTHQHALPALGIGTEPEDQTMHERGSEATSHILYGVVTEQVRSLVRKLL